MDRLVDLQVQDALPLSVMVVRPRERIAAVLTARRAAPPVVLPG